MGRFVRDVCMGWGLSQNWATAVAAAVVVLLAVAIVGHHSISPVALICGVLPLGAAVAMFNMILDLMMVSSSSGGELSAASVALIANTGKVFTGTLAIALGLGAGMAIVRFIKREELEDEEPAMPRPSLGKLILRRSNLCPASSSSAAASAGSRRPAP